MEKFVGAFAKIILFLTPIMIAVLLALGWALIFHPEILFRMVCVGLGGVCLIGSAAVCIGIVRALVLRFRK